MHQKCIITFYSSQMSWTNRANGELDDLWSVRKRPVLPTQPPFTLKTRRTQQNPQTKMQKLQALSKLEKTLEEIHRTHKATSPCNYTAVSVPLYKLLHCCRHEKKTTTPDILSDSGMKLRVGVNKRRGESVKERMERRNFVC